jgi:hypothetical protein
VTRPTSRAPLTRLLALGDAASRADGAGGVVGAKAQRLARALHAGLPVLPGWVVPAAEGDPALAAGIAAVRQAGRPAGRRAVLAGHCDPALTEQLQAAVSRLGGRVIVRPSSPLGADTRWSGAISPATGVRAADIAATVRLCWASAFGVRPLERLALCGLRVEALELALLLQPEIQPTAGGLAHVGVAGGGAAGEVTVEAVRGDPACVLSGWATGVSARIPLPARSAAAVPPGARALSQVISAEMTAAVTRLAWVVHRELGDDTIEWAAVGSTIYLLQSRSPAAGSSQQAGAHRPLTAMPPQHARTAAVFARLLDRLSPGLAEKYVLPWAGGTPRIDRLCSAVMSAPMSPARLAGRPVHLPTLYHEAMRQAWRDGPGPGGRMFEDAAHRAVTGLTGESMPDSLAMLASARPVDSALAARLLEAVARQDGCAAAPAGRQTAHRWLPFLASTVRSYGGHVPACPAVPGIAVGRLIRCGPHERSPARHEGAILLVDHPLPAQAPLLLAARGVIARTPGPHPSGAGRGVPTVIGCRPEAVTGGPAADGSWLAAIDGSTGDVALLSR